MKKLITTLFILFAISAMTQSINNGDFEIWSFDTFYEEPEFYHTSNQLSFAGAGISNVTKITDAVDGNYAARLETIMTNQGVGAGTIFNGTWDEDNQEVTGGYPYNMRPNAVTYHSRYNTVPGDSAFFLVAFKLSGFPFGIAFDTLVGTQEEYVSKTIPITWYIPNFLPDSVFVGISSSTINDPRVGNFLEVDNIVFEGVSLACPNGSFENWVDFSNEEANGWLSSNFFTIPVSDTSVTKSEESYEGDYAIRIENFKTIWEDTLGFITNGILGPNGATGGMAVENIPETISGMYKYESPEGDTAIAHVALYHFNELSQETDTLEFIVHDLLPVNEYTYFEIPVAYNGEPYPDTVNISFGTSNFLQESTQVGSGNILFIDDLNISYKPNLAENQLLENPPQLYPNPVKDVVKVIFEQFNKPILFEIYNTMGILVSSHQLQNMRNEVDVADLPSGLYYYRMYRENKSISGNFMVQ